MGASVQITGATEVAALLRQIADRDLQKANRVALRKGADLVAADARVRAPVRSGNLRSQIRSASTQTGATVRGSAPYTAAIHWGRKRGNVGSPPGNHMGPNVIKGRPFITAAAERRADDVADIYLTEVMSLFDRIGGIRG